MLSVSGVGGGRGVPNSVSSNNKKKKQESLDNNDHHQEANFDLNCNLYHTIYEENDRYLFYLF